MSVSNSLDVQKVMSEAIEAANIAGQEWMNAATPKFSVYNSDLITGAPIGAPVGTMLDNCGNAHVRFRNKKSGWFKFFQRCGAIRNTESGVIEIWHNWKSRQEYGLQVACATAAKKVLEDYGVTGLYVWDYID